MPEGRAHSLASCLLSRPGRVSHLDAQRAGGACGPAGSQEQRRPGAPQAPGMHSDINSRAPEALWEVVGRLLLRLDMPGQDLGLGQARGDSGSFLTLTATSGRPARPGCEKNQLVLEQSLKAGAQEGCGS